LLLELKQIAKDWDWLVDLDQFTLIEVSPFGDLFMKDTTDAFCLLDINMGELQYAETAGISPIELFPIAFDGRIAIDYIKAGLMPAEGQCFGYKVQLVTSGSLESSNVYVATLTEYISFMGEFHRQIQDIPDGTTVTIKVINKKVIP
jgi:hypothetical protein